MISRSHMLSRFGTSIEYFNEMLSRKVTLKMLVQSLGFDSVNVRQLLGVLRLIPAAQIEEPVSEDGKGMPPDPEISIMDFEGIFVLLRSLDLVFNRMTPCGKLVWKRKPKSATDCLRDIHPALLAANYSRMTGRGMFGTALLKPYFERYFEDMGDFRAFARGLVNDSAASKPLRVDIAPVIEHVFPALLEAESVPLGSESSVTVSKVYQYFDLTRLILGSIFDVDLIRAAALGNPRSVYAIWSKSDIALPGDRCVTKKLISFKVGKVHVSRFPYYYGGG